MFCTRNPFGSDRCPLKKDKDEKADIECTEENGSDNEDDEYYESVEIEIDHVGDKVHRKSTR